MAVGTPANLAAGLDTTDAASFATAAFTPTASAKLLAFVCVGHRTITPSFPSSLSGHSVTWTKVTDLTTSNNTWNCSLWEAVASGSPSSGTLTFNLGATGETCTWRVVEATAAQVVQTKTLATSVANPSLTLDNAIGAGGVALGFLMNNNATTTLTAGSGYTDIGTQQSSGTAPVFKQAAEYDMTGTTTVAYTASGTVVRALIGVELGPAPVTANLGQATTTNTSATATYTKAATAGQVTEADGGLAPTLTKTVTEGQASTTNSALAATATKAGALGLVAETDSALTPTQAKAVTLGLSSDTETGLAATVTKSAALGLTTETDSGLAAAYAKTVTLGLATETDAGLTLTVSGGTNVNLEQATETDSALTPTVTKVITLGLATETATAPSLTVSKSVAAGIATAVDTALGITTSKATPLGLATSAEQSAAATLVKAGALGLAGEADAALALVLPSGPVVDHPAESASSVVDPVRSTATVGTQRTSTGGITPLAASLTDAYAHTSSTPEVGPSN